MDRLEGIVAVWIPTRAFGFICTQGREVQRYFFHLNEIVKGQDQVIVGAKATFAVSPIRAGKNLTAIQVEIGEDGAL
jgi:cold shock CspA family protein